MDAMKFEERDLYLQFSNLMEELWLKRFRKFCSNGKMIDEISSIQILLIYNEIWKFQKYRRANFHGMHFLNFTHVF